MRKDKRDEVYNKVGRQYQVALLTVLGDEPPNIRALLRNEGIEFALQVLKARKEQNETKLLRDGLYLD